MTDKEQIGDIGNLIFSWAADNGRVCDGQAVEHIAEYLFNAGYRKIIPNVDFVVRASDLVGIREKAVKDTAKEILQEFWHIRHGQTELDNVCIRLAEKYGLLKDLQGD